MFNHQLSPSSLEDYRQRFDSMEDSELYKREANQLLGTFFANHLHRQTDKLVLVQEHFNIVQVTYVQKHSQLFWDIYWQNFSNCLLYQKRIEDIFYILDFWFGQFWINAPSKPQDKIPYFIPQFFMQLPEIFRKRARNMKQSIMNIDKNIRYKNKLLRKPSKKVKYLVYWGW